MSFDRYIYRSPINFAQGWEDHKVIEKALDIKKGDVVGSILASGDNVLNLLLYEPEKIYTFDISAAQICEVKLKLAAIQNLNHYDFLTLLGYQGNKTERIKIFESLSKNLDDETYRFWKKYNKMMKKGFSFQGYWEKKLASRRFPLKLCLGEDYIRFANSESRSERNEIYQKRLNRPSINFILDLYTKIILRIINLDKGAYARNLPSPSYITTDYLQKIFHYLVDIQCKNNPYRYWELTGKMPEDRKCWQPYLQEENYEKLRKNIHKITIIHDDVYNGLKSFDNNSIDKFYLSDIFCWMNLEEMDKTLSEVVKVAKNNAKMVYFIITYDKGIPESIQKYVRTDMEKNRSFWEMDRYGIYSYFYLLEVVK
jgi:S-adenosylmethionine-diacylglycerol 3-amino-3-carboxypropyl transferase